MRLQRVRLANAAWPRSALVTEAKSAGISEAALDAAVLAVGAKTVDGRLTFNGHAYHDAPVVQARRWSTIARRCGRRECDQKDPTDGPRPAADVARRLSEMGLSLLLQPAAEKLGVRCRGGPSGLSD